VTFAVEHRREAEERERLLVRMAAERARLATVLRHRPVGVLVGEAPSVRIVLANEQASRIWRTLYVAAERVPGYADYRAFHADGQPSAPEDWPLARAVAAAEAVLDEEAENVRGDGTHRVIAMSAAPLLDPDGGVEGAVVLFADVTERRRVQETLRETEYRYR